MGTPTSVGLKQFAPFTITNIIRVTLESCLCFNLYKITACRFHCRAIANEPNVVQSFTYTPADTAVLENNVFFAIEGTSSEPADFVVNIGTPTVTGTQLNISF